MSSRITEKALVLPSLYVMEKMPDVSTSQLIVELTNVFRPIGEDAEILSGRSDTKFSQIVRNLKSHRASNGMETLTNFNNEVYSITNAGSAYLHDNIELVEYLFENDFDYEDAKNLVTATKKSTTCRKLCVYSEKETIVEGAELHTDSVTRKRSKRLRSAAFARYSRADGHIICDVCGFDYFDKYGDCGKDYIELHHLKPLFQYSDADFERYIDEAINNIKPVCSNCHRMIHRKTSNPMQIGELRTLINNARQ